MPRNKKHSIIMGIGEWFMGFCGKGQGDCAPFCTTFSVHSTNGSLKFRCATLCHFFFFLLAIRITIFASYAIRDSRLHVLNIWFDLQLFPPSTFDSENYAKTFYWRAFQHVSVVYVYSCFHELKTRDPKNIQISLNFRWPAWKQYWNSKTKLNNCLPVVVFVILELVPKMLLKINKSDFSPRFSQVNKLATEQSQKKSWNKNNKSVQINTQYSTIKANRCATNTHKMKQMYELKNVRWAQLLIIIVINSTWAVGDFFLGEERRRKFFKLCASA